MSGNNGRSFSYLFVFLLISLLVSVINSQGQTVNLAVSQSNVYIVYLGERRQNDDPELITESHHDMLDSLMGSKQLESMVYSYRHGFSGFAAKLTESQAKQLSENPDVVGVIPDTFLGFSSQILNNLLHESNMGDGVNIGVLDTGIWPESKSFRDEGLGRNLVQVEWFLPIRVCENLSLRRDLVLGKVVLCFTTLSSPVVTLFASLAVRAAGGVGVIVSKLLNEISAECRTLPCAEVDHEVGIRIVFYIRSTSTPLAKLSPPITLVGKAVSAKIAEFSSRGPNTIEPSILKPDIAAPGVQIIAATSGLGTSAEQGSTMLSRTSMATPHVAGIVTLLRALHPDWSPVAIKSALTTTAWTTNPYGIPIFADGNQQKIADPFDFGGGIANPNGAASPGLIYDTDTTDYINYLCSMEYNNADISRLSEKPITCPNKTMSILDVNLPSITIPYLKNSTTLTRTVTNVGPKNAVYPVIVEPPTGTFVFVNPPVLFFNCKNKKMSFKVTVITSTHQLNGGYYFGSLIWTDGVHNVRSPIYVKISSV